MAKITSKVKRVAKTDASTVKKNAAAAASVPKPAAVTKTNPGPSKSSGGSSSSKNKLPLTGGTRESLNPVGPAAPARPQFSHSTVATATDDLAMRKRKAASSRGSAGGTASRSIGGRGPSKTFKSSVKTPGRMK